MQENKILDALKMLKKGSELLTPHFNNLDSIYQSAVWNNEVIRKENEKLREEGEIQRKATEALKAEGELSLQRSKEKVKAIEDTHFKKLAEINAEVSLKRAELEKLNGDIYKLTQSTLGQEVTKKAKVNV